MFGISEETQNIVLEHLRHIRSTVDATAAERRRSNMRVNLLEHGHGNILLSEAEQNSEIERIKARLDRVVRRLDLAD
jgi:hypothetical protein